MDRAIPAAIVTVVIVLLLVLMYGGWRARARRQNFLPQPVAVPDLRGEVLAIIDGTYIATSFAGTPLDRIVGHGLGFRATTRVIISGGGVLADLPGTQFWIPESEIVAHGRATWTIDRAVEPGGLQVVEWSWGARRVESYFRVSDPTTFDHAMNRLIGARRSI